KYYLEAIQLIGQRTYCYSSNAHLIEHFSSNIHNTADWRFESQGVSNSPPPGSEMPMKVKEQLQKTPHHSRKDAIRIVPLHKPEAQALAPASAPKLVYRGGPLIRAVEVFTIFWGGDWQQEPSAGILAQMNQFFDFVLTSSLMDQLSEYNVAGQSIGHGKRTGTITLTAPAPPASVTDQAIQQLLQQEISSNSAFPQPSPNTLYFLFAPPGTTV